MPFVKCCNCITVLKWRAKDGTSSLRGHLQHCSCKLSLATRKITEMPGFSDVSTVAVPSSVKSQMANDIVPTCATDIRPFSIVDGGGFTAVAQLPRRPFHHVLRRRLSASSVFCKPSPAHCTSLSSQHIWQSGVFDRRFNGLNSRPEELRDPACGSDSFKQFHS